MSTILVHYSKRNRLIRFIHLGVFPLSLALSLGIFLHAYWTNEEHFRDCQVIEIVLNEIISRANTKKEHKLCIDDHFVNFVLDYQTEEVVRVLGKSSVDLIHDAISRGKQANRGNNKFSFKFQNKDIEVINLTWMKTYKGLTSIKFWEDHPDAFGYAYSHRPGYSKDGQTALVVVELGPSIHSRMYACLLRKTNNHWHILNSKLVDFQ